VIYRYVHIKCQIILLMLGCRILVNHSESVSGIGNSSLSGSTLATGNSSSSDIEKSVEPPCQEDISSLSSKSSSGMARLSESE